MFISNTQFRASSTDYSLPTAFPENPPLATHHVIEFGVKHILN